MPSDRDHWVSLLQAQVISWLDQVCPIKGAQGTGRMGMSPGKRAQKGGLGWPNHSSYHWSDGVTLNVPERKYG
jgi:hypothetical protein